jgi:sulfoacetaldehyde acetyltransferase
MELIQKADVVLALGTRLNPFSTLPGYGMDYWPKDASIIQVDMNSDRIGLTKKVTVGICGDAKLVSQQLLAQLSPTAGDTDRQKRKDIIHQTKSAWLQKLSSLDHEMMTRVQFGIKKLEKEIQIECHLDKLGEQFKPECQMM